MFPITLLDLIYFSQVSVLIPIIAWIIFVRKASISLRLILTGTIFAGIAELLLILFAHLFKNNIIVFNFSNIPHLIFFFLAYYLHKDFTPPIRRVIGITGLAGLFFLFLNLLRHDIRELILPNLMASSFLFILLALYYFFHKIFFTTAFEVSRHPFFYISSALFINNLSVFTVHATYNILWEDESANYLWALKMIFNALYNITLAYSFYIFKKFRLSL